MFEIRKTYNNITPDPIVFPDSARIEAFDDEISPFMFATAGLIEVIIQIIWLCLASKTSVSTGLTQTQAMIDTRTLDTNPEQFLPAKPVRDNRQYMAQDCRSLV